MINDDKRKADKAEVDQELTDELKQTFPASDPPTITRQPLDRHVESEKQEKKKKRD